jgi:hypothetical protein
MQIIALAHPMVVLIQWTASTRVTGTKRGSKVAHASKKQ